MVKLIRIISDANNTTADYSNHFQEDIVVNPNAKVGLLNLGLNVNPSNIQIGPDNDTFKPKTRATADYTASLAHGSYNKRTLVKLLNQAINSAVTNSNDDGFAWSVILVENKIKIQWRRGESVTNNPNILYTTTTMQLTANNEIKKLATASSTAWNAYFGSVKYLICGAGYSQVTIDNYQNNNQFAFGLITNIMSYDPDSLLQPEDYDYSVFSQGNTYHVFIKSTNVTTDTNTPVASGDVIRFRQLGGYLILYINDVEQGRISTDYSRSYHVYGSIKNNNGVFFEDFEMTESPFLTSGVSGVTETLEVADGDESNYILGAVHPTNVSVDWVNAATASLFGFHEVVLGPKLLRSGHYTASIPLDDYHIKGNIIVELVNISVDAYDGKLNRRRNIVAVVPALEKDGLNLKYENQNPVMIDIHNQEPFLLNELQVRVLGVEDQPIPINPLGCAITFVISD